MDRLFQAIQSRGEAIPGDLAQELGWARSALAYNLGRLQGLSKIKGFVFVRRGKIDWVFMSTYLKKGCVVQPLFKLLF